MIRPLEPDEATAFSLLRREYLLAAPLAFSSSPENDPATVEAIQRILSSYPQSIILGAFAPGLVGTVALYRSPEPKSAHKAHLWGMFVKPSHRGRGIGTRLLDAALAHARRLAVDWIHLSVTSAAPEARRLYERAGFQVWGTEPDALRHDGESVDEFHMAMWLPG